MPEVDENHKSLGLKSSTIDDANTNPAQATSESRGRTSESINSPAGSESDFPCPFDSQSSIDEENGDRRKKTSTARLVNPN